MRPLADYPKHPDLDALVAAFHAGDYRRVRDEAPKLAAREDVDEDVRGAARDLRSRIEADPLAKMLLAVTGALLLLLTAYWISKAAGGPPKGTTPAPPAPTIEIVR